MFRRTVKHTELVLETAKEDQNRNDTPYWTGGRKSSTRVGIILKEDTILKRGSEINWS